MRYIKLILLLIGFCAYTNVCAQLSTNEKPISFGRESELRVSRENANPRVVMPQLDYATIEKEDEVEKEQNIPPRFAFPHKVNYNLNNSGVWYDFSNGDKLWRLNIVCPNAKSIGVCFDEFWIPEGGKLFIYSADKKNIRGAFTSINNKGDREHPRGFTTCLISGCEVVLEYYQPKEIMKDAIISAKSVAHGYRNIRSYEYGFGCSSSCMVNINCPQGYNWQSEKHAVALIVFDDATRLCSGALLNTTKYDQKPLLLTAYHNIHNAGYFVDQQSYLSNPILDEAVFYWDYELNNCNDTIEPSPYSTHAAEVISNNYVGEFSLLRLSEDPKNLPGFTPCYLGWDNSVQSGTPGACIHHPVGDVKKISIVDTLISTRHLSEFENLNEDHWKVTWGCGITQPGSSGSPLLNADHKLIGLLHGGYSQCEEVDPHDWFVKFSAGWHPAYSDYPHQWLDCWLDTVNSTIQSIESLFVVATTKTIDNEGQLWGIIQIKSTGQLIIKNDVKLGENSPLIVNAGGQLIIDGGRLSNVNLDLKPGATLRIINGGILETQHRFKAPIGAIVDISHGKIL